MVGSHLFDTQNKDNKQRKTKRCDVLFSSSCVQPALAMGNVVCIACMNCSGRVSNHLTTQHLCR